LIWLPTDGDAENFMKTHVEPTIRDIPSLLALAPWYGKKHRDNTLTMKRFSNGRGFWCLGGKAAKNYREKSVDVAGYDELAAFDEDIEQEGSPTFLGDKRIEGSVWPKSIRGSTPKVRGTCQIERAASESPHFMRFHVACPHCGEEQYLKFGDKETPFGLKWTPDDPSSVFYLCEHMRGWTIKGKPASGRAVLSQEQDGIKSHTHSASASSTDLGTKTTSSFDYGTKSTNNTGAHTHSLSGSTNAAGNHSHRDGRRFNPSVFKDTYQYGYTSSGQNTWGVQGSVGMSTGWLANTSTDGNHSHSLSGTAASADAHAHTVGIGAHTHSVAIGSHGHTITVNAAGNAENTVKNIAFNYIVRLA
ncbi:TPA: phage terminase large subunit family protein, partial [Escherichia coli]